MCNSGKRTVVAHRSSELNQNILLCATALKNITEDDKNIRQEGAAVNQPLLRCPKVSIPIEEIRLKALLDPSSEIMCISQEFYKNIQQPSMANPLSPSMGRKLIKKCIIDTDSQKGQKMLIDTNRKEIYMSINQTNENLSYKATPLDKDSLIA